MKLTVVGCSGSFPGPDSAASCYLVEHDGFRVVLDLGHGALGPLQQHTSLDDLGAVVISHLHLDHVIDLCALYVARRYDPRGLQSPIRVIAPPGARLLLAHAGGIDLDALDEVLSFEDMASRSDVGPFELATAIANHPVEAYGLRLEADAHSLTYTGDTGPCPALVELARGTDLLVAESSFIDGVTNPPDLHLTGSQAGLMATEAEVDQLLVTHVPPWHSRERAVAGAATTFAGDLSAAEPGRIITVGAGA